MRDNWQVAIDFVLANEGGYVDNFADPGGATNFGISFRFLHSLDKEKLKRYGIFEEGELTHRVVADLTVEQAKLIYRGEFWDGIRFKEIEDASVCAYVFDCCVQHGLIQGIKIAQRACWATMVKSRECLQDDGILGDETLSFVNLVVGSWCIQTALLAERAGVFRALVAGNPKNEVFLEGWLNRCYRWP